MHLGLHSKSLSLWYRVVRRLLCWPNDGWGFHLKVVVGVVRWQHCDILLLVELQWYHGFGRGGRLESLLCMWQIMAWSMVNAAPQLQICGVFLSSQSYLRLTVSWNYPLWRKNPWSGSGRAVNQDEDPFSTARSTQRFSCGVSCA